MKKIRNFILLIIIILIGGLFYFKQNEPLTNYKIFESYLTELNLTISEEKTHYILVPKVGCQGAMANVLMKLDSVLSVTNCNYVLITSNSELTSQFISNDKKLVIDVDGRLDILNLPISNVSVITTENYTISNIISSSKCENNIVSTIVHQLIDC